MKTLLAAFLLAASFASAQDISAVVAGASGESALPSSYLFDAVPVGTSASLVVRLRNASANPVLIAAVTANQSQGMTSSASPDFTITGQAIAKILAPSTATSFEDVNLNFVPQTTGLVTAYLQVTYQLQANGCDFTSQTASTQCPSNTLLLSIVQGTGAAAQVVLSYQNGGNQVALTPNATSALDFGNVSTSSSASITFTLTNQTSSALATPPVALQTQAYNSTAFKLDTSGLAASLPANGSTTFSITFAPGQVAQSTATLSVGTGTYPLSGTGIVLTDIDALAITYTDSTGVRLTAQGASPIDFGQVITGTSQSAALTFTVTNPLTSFNAVPLSLLAVTGVGFALNNSPTAPISIAPGASISFQVVFTPNAAGAFSGQLAIGTRQFSLTGTGTQSSLDLTMQVDMQPLNSQQQAHLIIQSGVAAPSLAIGVLTMTFTPSVAGVKDDPAIVFTATSGRQLQITLNQGSQTGTYSGQSQLTFQTGTTAGTITFSLAFPNQAAVTKSFTILPAQISITSAKAVRQSPNLVLTLTGFDNTYTAGTLAFTFYNTSGAQINASPITVDASSEFRQYFLTESKAGGAFSLQASFPVTGDVNQVGSVKADIVNSSGTSTTNQTFQ